MPTEVGPHSFVKPKRKWYGRQPQFCLGCYFPEEFHPTRSWATARPIGDVRRMTAAEAVLLDRHNQRQQAEEGSDG